MRTRRQHCTAVAVALLDYSHSTIHTLSSHTSTPHIYSFFLISTKNWIIIHLNTSRHSSPRVYRRNSGHHNNVVNRQFVDILETKCLASVRLTSVASGQRHTLPKNVPFLTLFWPGGQLRRPLGHPKPFQLSVISLTIYCWPPDSVGVTVWPKQGF